MDFAPTFAELLDVPLVKLVGKPIDEILEVAQVSPNWKPGLIRNVQSVINRRECLQGCSYDE